MIICKVDNKIFTTATTLAKHIGCAPSLITMMANKYGLKFKCKGKTVEILEKHHPEYRKTEARREYSRKYYAEHRDFCKEKSRAWRKAHPERVKEKREEWRINHKEWYNNYYREQRRLHKLTKIVDK